MVEKYWAERLELLRGDRKQKEFAEWLGESPVTINSYLGSKRRPGVDLLISLATRNVNLNWFVTGKGEVWLKDSDAKAGVLSPNQQTLLHELEGWEFLFPSIIRFTQQAKDLKRTQYQITEDFEQLKTIVSDTFSYAKKKKK